jgi:organic hydroperoxide reductase OsmC/OhrA
MLTVLAIAARKRIGVRSYRDSAVGHMEKNEQGRVAITRVELSPRIEFDGEAPDARTLAAMHHSSHEECFIANSVRTTITVT